MFRFNRRYALLTVLLFLTEVVIARYFHDDFVRPYLGDVLVVILVYAFLSTFFAAPAGALAVASLLIAYAVEFLQYLNLLRWLGMENSRIAALLLGNYFTWIDMVAYTAGFLLIVAAERDKLFRKSVSKL
jgi:hypothetical protein